MRFPQLVKLAGGDPSAIRDMTSHPMNFMYAPPPGMARSVETDAKEAGESDVALLAMGSDALSSASPIVQINRCIYV